PSRRHATKLCPRDLGKGPMGVPREEGVADEKLQETGAVACHCHVCGAVDGAMDPGGGETAAWWGVTGGPCRGSTEPGHAPGTNLCGEHPHGSRVQHPGYVRPASLSQSHWGSG